MILHYTLLTLFYVVPAFMLGCVAWILWQARLIYLEMSGRNRIQRLRRRFRESYIDWKAFEKSGEYVSYIHRHDAEMFAQELTRLGH